MTRGWLRGAGGGALMVLIVVSPLPVHAESQDGGGAVCAADSLDRALVQHIRAGEFLDAHGLAQVLMSLCPSSRARFRWQTLDALALDQLDEPLRAQQSLSEVALRAPMPQRETATTLLARSHLITGDGRAFTEVLARLSPPIGARLRLFAARDDAAAYRRGAATLNDPPLAAAALNAFDPYEQAAHTRRPWLAGTLSAVLPGTGQIYAGSWQGAAVAFVLNAVLIGATAELAYHRLYISAGATSLAASIFYVGNILNAADLAARRNEQSALAHREALERLLIPEAFP